MKYPQFVLPILVPFSFAVVLFPSLPGCDSGETDRPSGPPDGLSEWIEEALEHWEGERFRAVWRNPAMREKFVEFVLVRRGVHRMLPTDGLDEEVSRTGDPVPDSSTAG